eukprot:12590880-Alexandrium_andersonii.AAC.1
MASTGEIKPEGRITKKQRISALVESGISREQAESIDSSDPEQGRDLVLQFRAGKQLRAPAT